MRTLRAAVWLLVLALAVPVRALDVRAEPRAIVQGITLHLDNLASLSELPQSEPMALKTVPERALTQLPVSYIQQAYIREATIQQVPGEAAAGLIVEAVSNHPSLVGRVGEALQKSAPDDPATKQAVEGLWRWAARRRGGAEEPGETDRAWARIAGLFDGTKTISVKTAAPVPANDDAPARRKDGLIAYPATVKPRRKQVDAWLKVPGDPVEEAFAGVDPILASEFLEMAHAPIEYHAAASAWLRTGNADAKARLAARPDLVQAFLSIRRSRAFEGVLQERHGSLPELINSYRAQGPAALRAVLDRTVEQRGDYVVAHDAHSWRMLSEPARDQAVAHMDAENFGTRTTAKLYLELSHDTELADVARRYAFGRRTDAIEKYLAMRVRRIPPGARVRVPLENVMPTWIRKAIERFEECTGPNCVSAGLGVHEDRAHRHRYVAGEEMVRVLGESFEKADPSKELEPGDILVYTDMSKNFLHMAAYVGGGFVFNKMGASRYNPYVFQPKAVVETAYFRADGLRMLVFRRKKS